MELIVLEFKRARNNNVNSLRTKIMKILATGGFQAFANSLHTLNSSDGTCRLCFQVQLRLTQFLMLTVIGKCSLFWSTRFLTKRPCYCFRLLAEMSCHQKLYSPSDSVRQLVNYIERAPSELDLEDFALSHSLTVFPKEERHWNEGDCNEA